MSVVHEWEELLNRHALAFRFTKEAALEAAGYDPSIKLTGNVPRIESMTDIEREAMRLSVPVPLLSWLLKGPSRMLYTPLLIEFPVRRKCPGCKVPFVEGETIIRRDGGYWFHIECSIKRSAEQAAKEQAPATAMGNAPESAWAKRGRIIKKGDGL